MKCLILAAGYATRLYPLTENFPKPLLKVKGKAIIDWLIDDLNSLNIIDEYYLVSNHKFYDHFVSWNKYDNLKIIDDGTISNDGRLGAVRDIELVINNELIDDDLLIVAGDNILDFSLKNYLEYHKKVNTSCVLRYYEADINVLRKNGVASVDENGLIINMEEKPSNPTSNWITPPFYIVNKGDLGYISKAINDGYNVDAPGSFIAYLSNKTKVHAYIMDGKRYDIGTIDSYNKVKDEYKGINMSNKNDLKDEELNNVSAGSDAEPEEFDWKTKGYVTPIKEKGPGWKFEAIGYPDGCYVKKTGSYDDSDNNEQ